MKLPFLNNSKWPRVREDEERVANPSYDTQLQDHLVDELFKAFESKNAGHIREALMALIHSIKNEDVSDEM